MASPAFDQNLAIAIGIDQYSGGIPALGTAVADATAIARLLKTDHDYRIELRTNTKAKLQDLQKLLEETLPRMVKPSDRLIFYFAGHGIALNGEDGPEGFLIPQDARLGDTQTYLPMVQLQQLLIELPCRHFLAIFDCCFAGAFRWSSTRDIGFVPEVIHQERYDRFLLDPAWQVITSAAHDQTALDSFTLRDVRGQRGKHSPFAVALMEALEGQADATPPARNNLPPGDGVITATELYLYLRDRVEAPTHAQGQRQTPSLFALSKHDKGEYVFLSPGHPLNLPPAPPLDPAQNPYRGLEAFEEEHAALFFGRGDRIASLRRQVEHHPLTVVLGPSGSGKSSLVKAGLLPQLRTTSGTASDGSATGWKILGPIRPGNSPLQALVRVLDELKSKGNSVGINSSSSQQISTPKETVIRDIRQALQEWRHAHPEQLLLLVIDQLEELLTLGTEEEERDLFLNGVKQAIARPNLKHPAPQTTTKLTQQAAEAQTEFPIHLVLTLRSDFEPQFQEGILRDVWDRARFVLPPMDRAGLREAIELPATAKVMYFESEDPRQPLVEQIINEVADTPGALPLLSFTLSELYLKFLERQQIAQQQGLRLDRAILESDYKSLGGVAHSLTQRADQEYAALVEQDPDYAKTVRNVMLRMVAMGGGEVARRQVPLSELNYLEPENQRARAVIQRFESARLVVRGKDLMGQAYVEPAHDALVRGWKRLLSWQREEENLPLQRRVTQAAIDWEQEKKAKFLWNSNPRLDVLAQVLSSPNNWLNALETEFVQHSIARKRLNGRLWISGSLTVITLLSGFLISALLSQRSEVIALVRTYRETARSKLEDNHALDGLVNSLAAGRSLQNPLLRLLPPDEALQKQVQGTLQWAKYNVREQNRVAGHVGPVRSQWSPSGDVIASAGEDGQVILWNLQGEQTARWLADPQRVWHLSFSPEGERLATAGDDPAVRLWNLNGEEIVQLLGHQSAVHYVSFSAGGQYLASTSRDDGRLVLWNLQSLATASAPLATWRVHPQMAKSVNFHPQQPWLVTTDPQSLKLWTLRGKLLKSFPQHAWSAVFTPDGNRIVAAGDDGRVGIWDVATGKSLALVRADAERLWNLTLSPDGRAIATAGEDGIVKLWSFEGKQLSEFRSHVGPSRSVSFAPDGLSLTSAGDDGKTRIWQTQTLESASVPVGSPEVGGEIPRDRQRQQTPNGQWLAEAQADGSVRLVHRGRSQFLRGNIRAVEQLRFSPDEQQLAVAGTSGLIEIWSIATGERLQQLFEHIGPVHSIEFSPVEAQRLVSAGADGTIRQWDLEQGKSVGSPFQVYGQDLLSVAYRPDGLGLASGDRSGFIQLWDLVNAEQQATWQAHPAAVTDVQFREGGEQLITAGEEGQVKRWPLDSFEQLLEEGCDRARPFLSQPSPAPPLRLCPG